MLPLLIRSKGTITNPDPSLTIQCMADTHHGGLTPARSALVPADKPITPLSVYIAGDVTEHGTNAEEVISKAWLDLLGTRGTDVFIINAGHDLADGKTPAQVAAVYGMSGQLYTVDHGTFMIIAMGGFDVGDDYDAAMLAYLDAQLAAAGKPCVVVAHRPLFYSVLAPNETDYFGSEQGVLGARTDEKIRTILASHDNAKVYISGEVHAPYYAPHFVKSDLVGTHNMALINSSSIFYTNITTGETPTEPCVSVYVTVTTANIEVRLRDHLRKIWIKHDSISLQTGLDEPATQFKMSFAVNHAARIPQYIAADIGTLRSYPANNVAAVTGGVLRTNGNPDVLTLYYPVHLMFRKCGRAFKFDIPLQTTIVNQKLHGSLIDGNIYKGNVTYASSTIADVYSSAGARIYASPALAAGIHSYMLVMRDTGTLLLQRDSNWAANQWRLLWVYNAGTMALRPQLRTSAAAAVDHAFDNMEVSDLTGVFATQNGLAAAAVAVTADGETITGVADVFIEHTITAQAGVTQELMFRRTDDNNCMIVRMNQGASTIELLRKSAGAETSMQSAAFTWTDTVQYRIVVISHGPLVRVTVDETAQILYQSSAVHQGDTGIKVSHAGTNLIAWPYNPIL